MTPSSIAQSFPSATAVIFISNLIFLIRHISIPVPESLILDFFIPTTLTSRWSLLGLDSLIAFCQICRLLVLYNSDTATACVQAAEANDLLNEVENEVGGRSEGRSENQDVVTTETLLTPPSSPLTNSTNQDSTHPDSSSFNSSPMSSPPLPFLPPFSQSSIPARRSSLNTLQDFPFAFPLLRLLRGSPRHSLPVSSSNPDLSFLTRIPGDFPSPDPIPLTPESPSTSFPLSSPTLSSSSLSRVSSSLRLQLSAEISSSLASFLSPPSSESLTHSLPRSLLPLPYPPSPPPLPSPPILSTTLSPTTQSLPEPEISSTSSESSPLLNFPPSPSTPLRVSFLSDPSRSSLEENQLLSHLPSISPSSPVPVSLPLHSPLFPAPSESILTDLFLIPDQLGTLYRVDIDLSHCFQILQVEINREKEYRRKRKERLQGHRIEIERREQTLREQGGPNSHDLPV